MDFRAWAVSIEKSSSMRFHFVSSEDFTSYDQSRLNPVHGTMQIHQIVGIGNNQLIKRFDDQRTWTLLQTMCKLIFTTMSQT